MASLRFSPSQSRVSHLGVGSFVYIRLGVPCFFLSPDTYPRIFYVYETQNESIEQKENIYDNHTLCTMQLPPPPSWILPANDQRMECTPGIPRSTKHLTSLCFFSWRHALVSSPPGHPHVKPSAWESCSDIRGKAKNDSCHHHHP